MIGACELCRISDDLFKALSCGRFLAQLIDNLIDDFDAFIKKIRLDDFINGSASAYYKSLVVDFQVFIYIRWKFHFNLRDLIISMCVYI